MPVLRLCIVSSPARSNLPIEMSLLVFDVTTSDFQVRVLDRSVELPVVVDFWAAWCAPCRQLGPALEAAVERRQGAVELAKLDVDSNQALAQRYRIQGIPAVKAFRDGALAAEFTGAIPPPQIEAFLDSLAPNPADKLAAAGDEASLRQALEIDPRHTDAAAALARILLERGEASAAGELLSPFAHDFIIDGLKARIELEGAGNGSDPDGLAAAFAAWDGDELEQALESLQAEAAGESDPVRKDLIRQVMVAIFTELGVDHPLVRKHRRRLAQIL